MTPIREVRRSGEQLAGEAGGETAAEQHAATGCVRCRRTHVLVVPDAVEHDHAAVLGEAGRRSFYDQAEYERLVGRYGSMRHLQTQQGGTD